MNEEELVTIVVGQQNGPLDEHVNPDWDTDEVCAAAVDVARAAVLEEVDPAQVGDWIHCIAEGPLVVTHYFAGYVPGYVGWQWAVTVTRAPDSDHVTVDETALLPDAQALLAPAWVPWKNRIQSGDLGAGDVMVTEPDDTRLVAGLTGTDAPMDSDDELVPPEWELGLGRVRMLSPEGRREAAHRWYREVGPRAQIARAADLHCSTCGFLLLIGGPLGQAFGVCANGFSPVDGHIVAMDFGCGAHSETLQRPTVPVAEIVVDEVGYDAVVALPDDSDAAPDPDEVSADPGLDEAAAPEPDVETAPDVPADAEHTEPETMQGNRTEEDS